MVTRTGFAVGLMMCIAVSVPAGPPRSFQRGDQAAAPGVPQDRSAVGYLNLSRRHPDGAEGAIEFATEFTSYAALDRLTQMRSFLASFNRLTKRVRGTLTEAELSEVGNMSAEMQSIGFHNIPLIVEGTLLKQDYQLRQIEYELAQVRAERGEIGDEELERARSAYREATTRFQTFWDTRRPID